MLAMFVYRKVLFITSGPAKLDGLFSGTNPQLAKAWQSSTVPCFFTPIELFSLFVWIACNFFRRFLNIDVPENRAWPNFMAKPHLFSWTAALYFYCDLPNVLWFLLPPRVVFATGENVDSMRQQGRGPTKGTSLWSLETLKLPNGLGTASEMCKKRALKLTKNVVINKEMGGSGCWDL